MHRTSQLLATFALLAYGCSAHAYTCAELQADAVKPSLTQQDLNGFESIEAKLNAITKMFLDSFPKEVAEAAYNQHKAEGKVRNPYQASLLYYQEMLRVAYATNDFLVTQIPKEGGIRKFFVSRCKNPKNDVRGILQVIFLKVQEELNAQESSTKR